MPDLVQDKPPGAGKTPEVSMSNGKLSCGCLAFKFCGITAELRVALRGAVVQCNGYLFVLAFCL